MLYSLKRTYIYSYVIHKSSSLKRLSKFVLFAFVCEVNRRHRHIYEIFFFPQTKSLFQHQKSRFFLGGEGGVKICFQRPITFSFKRCSKIKSNCIQLNPQRKGVSVLHNYLLPALNITINIKYYNNKTALTII